MPAGRQTVETRVLSPGPSGVFPHKTGADGGVDSVVERPSWSFGFSTQNELEARSTIFCGRGERLGGDGSPRRRPGAAALPFAHSGFRLEGGEGFGLRRGRGCAIVGA